MKRTGLCMALSLMLSQQAQAQRFALAACGRIEGAAEGITASITTMDFGDGRIEPHEQVEIWACLPDRDGLNGRKCGLVFETSAADLVAAQWVGPSHLLVETTSLSQSGLQLHLEIQRSGLDLGSRVSIVPAQEPQPNAQPFVGQRISFHPAASRAAPPPIRAVAAPPN